MKTVTLFRHQERGVDKGLEILTKLRGLGIFFDPGLGKTLTSMTIVDTLIKEKEITNVVVVCPKTLYGTWQDQIREHTDFGPAFEFHATKLGQKEYSTKLALSASVTFYLVNYESFRSPRPELVNYLNTVASRAVVILDESTKIKSPASQQTKGTKKLLSKFWGRIIMTGTEITKSPLDLFSQFEFLRSGIWGSTWTNFKRRFAIMEDLYLPGGKITKKIVGFQNLHVLQQTVAPWIIRAKKEDCMDLPPKIFQNIPVEMSSEEWRVYQDLKKRLMAYLESGELITVDQKIALFTRFRTITGGWADTKNPISDATPSKLSTLIDFIEDDDKQAIIWCAFTHEIIMLTKELNKYGKCVTYYGGDSQEVRQANFTAFTNRSARFFIANPATASLGLNLQHCSLQYFYSLPTKADDFGQALDRSHRIGTKTEVVYRFLLGVRNGQNSIDWRVKALLDQSVDLLHAFQTREIRELVSFI